MTPANLPMWLRSVSSNGGDSPFAADLVTALAETLADIPVNGSWTTAQLAKAWGMSKAEEKDQKRLKNALWRLRDAGLVDGMWKPSPNRRQFGNPVILWVRPGVDESIF